MKSTASSLWCNLICASTENVWNVSERTSHLRFHGGNVRCGCLRSTLTEEIWVQTCSDVTFYRALGPDVRALLCSNALIHIHKQQKHIANTGLQQQAAASKRRRRIVQTAWPQRYVPDHRAEDDGQDFSVFFTVFVQIGHKSDSLQRRCRTT